MALLDRERILALRAGAQGADPNSNVAVKAADLVYLTEVAVAALTREMHKEAAKKDKKDVVSAVETTSPPKP